MEPDSEASEAHTSKIKLRKCNSGDDTDVVPKEKSSAGPSSTTPMCMSTDMDTFSSPWMAQYAIVKSVFQLLPLKDMLVASSVCQFWFAVGRFVREKRWNLASTILWHPYSEQGRTAEAVEYFNDVNVSQEVNQFMSSAVPSFIEVLDSDLPDERYKEWETCLQRDFIQQFSEAQMIILFATKSFVQYVRTRKKQLSKKKEQDALFGSTIPKTIPCVCAFGCGLAFSMPNSTTVYEVERFELPMVAGLLVPRGRGLKMRIVSLEKSIANLYKRRRSVTSENCQKILGISPEENVKGFIFMDADSYGRYTNPFMDAAFHFIKDNPNTCFAGGSVFYTLTSASAEETSEQLGFGILITENEDESVKVGTIGLFQPGITQENEEKLKKFQALISHGEDSFAFMFACNGRGAYMHNKEHVEVTLFRKHYPNTPIIGIFTNGELAHEYLPGENPPPPENRASLEFTFSTIFLFVSYKH